MARCRVWRVLASLRERGIPKLHRGAVSHGSWKEMAVQRAWSKGKALPPVFTTTLESSWRTMPWLPPTQLATEEGVNPGHPQGQRTQAKMTGPMTKWPVKLSKYVSSSSAALYHFLSMEKTKTRSQGSWAPVLGSLWSWVQQKHFTFKPKAGLVKGTPPSLMDRELPKVARKVCKVSDDVQPNVP